MPYGYTRMKWRKRKDSPWWLFHFQLLRTWQNFAHEESHENYTFLLQSHLWQLLWQKILNTDKPTNGYPNNWNFALTDKRGDIILKGFIFFLYWKIIFWIIHYWQLFYLLRLVDKQPSHHRWVLNLFILTTLTIITPISHSNLQPLLCFSYFQRLFQSCFFSSKTLFLWQGHVYHLAYFSTVFWYMIIVFLFLTPKLKSERLELWVQDTLRF